MSGFGGNQPQSSIGNNPQGFGGMGGMQRTTSWRSDPFAGNPKKKNTTINDGLFTDTKKR